VVSSAEFARLGASTVHEAAGRQGLLDVPWRQILPGSRAAGSARTVRCAQGDNLMVHAVMAVVEPGEVLVLTMPEPDSVALIGDLLATQAKARGVAAVLVDAAVRDVADLIEIGVPIWARHVTPRGPLRATPGALGEPVVVGGTTITDGDLVVLDADGAVCVPRAAAAAVLAAALDREREEDRLREQLRAGALTYDLAGLRALRLPGCP
jgi:4-hydroxy-4-methyl-2-oxoglutarate aldolase